MRIKWFKPQQIPDCVFSPTRPKDCCIIVAKSDASFEIWEPTDYAHAVSAFGNDPICDGWIKSDNRSPQWKARPRKRRKLEKRFVLVRGANSSYYATSAYAAELAAQLAGITDQCSLFDRGPDGIFRCPYCNKAYRTVGNFAGHFFFSSPESPNPCHDGGACAMIRGPEFTERNGRRFADRPKHSAA